MNTFDKVLRHMTEKMAWGGMFAILACVGLVVSDIIKRTLGFGRIPGVPELVELIAAIILSMGIGYLTYVKGHVAVGILVDRFSPRKQGVFGFVTAALALTFVILLTWGLFSFASEVQRTNWHSGSLQIPLYPFVYVVAASLALTCVVLIRDLIVAVITIVKGGKAS